MPRRGEPYGGGMRPILMRRLAALSLSTVLALTACGASEASVESVPKIVRATDAPVVTDAPVATQAPETTAATTQDPLDVEFSSEPIDAGPLFGGADAAVADPVAEDSASCEDQVEQGCVDIIDDEAPLFEPAAADQPFCSLLDDLDGRSFPSDDAEAATVIRVWIGELRNVAVESVRDDLDLLIKVLDDAIASGGDLTDLESTEGVDEASSRLEGYVAAACEGIGSLPVDDRPSVTFDDPPLPDGVVIPVIEFADSSETGRPIFGERDASKIDPDFVRAEAHQGFCTALDIVNSRPQPTEDVDEIRFVSGYLQAIEPLVPAEIETDFALLLDWTAAIVAAGDFTDEAEAAAEGPVEDAVTTINDFVDARCHGL